MNVNIKELEQQFHADGYRMGMYATEGGLLNEGLYDGVRAMYALVDEVIDAFTKYAEQHQKAPDCKKGCSWCCFQPVFVNSYELDTLNKYIGGKFPEEEQTAIYGKAIGKYSKTKALKGEQLLHSKHACPLLQNGMCSVYEMRPVACRIYLSTNVHTCKQFYSNPSGAESIPELLDLPMRLGRMINEGFGAALKANGVNVKELRIEEGLVNYKSTSP